ncbi:MAG TPA: UvrD-helicase domain-containing protein, partial [Burkholderiaceae bacterium]|nr:UvrD-helicase domain-containing protein [Burkholderiaceae bacterium]
MPSRAATDFDVLRCRLDGGIHLIEASAGTGKTWNLSALYLRLLLERRLDVRQILVVTFTRPAAAELRERIRGRLAQAHRIVTGGGSDAFVASLLQTVQRNADSPPAELAKRLHAALVAFDEAPIHTIHAFCQRALAQIPFAAGLPAHHELLQDDTELLQAALEDFWRCHVAGGRIPEALAAHLVRCDDSPQRWRELLRYLLAKPMAQLQWPEAAAATLPAALQRLAAAYDAAARAWAQPGPSPLDVLQSAVGLNRNAFKPAPIAEGARFWADDLHGGDLFGRAAKEARQRMALFCASRQQQALNRGATAPQHPFFDAADALVAARAAAQQALSLARIELIRQLRDEAGERVRLAKRQQRLVCFDDLLLRVHEALADHDRSDAHGGERSADSERSGLADALRACYPVALIDEFQDTDPMQYAIFERLYAGDAARGPLFLVGDPKQAIYGFRNADLHVYLNAKSDAATLHTLRYNQRSVQPLIDACNRLFGANPQAFVLPGLDSPRIEPGDKRPLPLRDDTERDGVGAALRIGWLPAAGTNGPLMKPDAERIAAAATAAEIARLLREARDGRIRIGDTPLQPGRIAVLVRTHAQGGRIKQALWAL